MIFQIFVAVFFTLKFYFLQAEIVRKKGKSLLNDPLFNKVLSRLETWKDRDGSQNMPNAVICALLTKIDEMQFSGFGISWIREGSLGNQRCLAETSQNAFLSPRKDIWPKQAKMIKNPIESEGLLPHSRLTVEEQEAVIMEEYRFVTIIIISSYFIFVTF